MKILPFQFNAHRPWAQAIKFLAHQRALSLLLVAFLSFGGSWFWATAHGWPVPVYHDEFSYLLAADTFAHGQWTNAPHPLWKSLETFHELMQPTYMSKYPPGQGFFLALGQVLFGHAIYGVWLSVGAMCAAICWMLYAWVPPLWALTGGVLAVVQFGIFSYWSQSYWGGAVAALGGALIFGAIPRVFKRIRWQDALWLCAGIFLVFNSRPYEAVVLGIPVGILCLRTKIRLSVLKYSCFVTQILLPFILFLLMMAGFTGFYNKQITGSPWVFPYQLYADTYAPAPVFIWQPLEPRVQINNRPMQQYQDDWVRHYLVEKKTWRGFLRDMTVDISRILNFYLGYALAYWALVVLVFSFPNKRRIGLCAGVASVALFYMAVTFCPIKIHYFAMLTGFFVLLVVTGLRAVALIKIRRQRVGGVMVMGLLVGQMLLNAATYTADTAPKSLARMAQPQDLKMPARFTREQLTRALKQKDGKCVVMVRYLPDHVFHWEWVYNEADIDQAKIIWVRDVSPEQNMRVMAYYPGRTFYYIDVVKDIKVSNDYKS